MNSLFNKHRWMQVMWGILLFVAGAITIIFTATSDEGADTVSLVLSIALAVVLFAYATTILFTAFLEMKDKPFSSELIFGSIIAAFALVFCLKFDFVKTLIVLFAAINLLCFGCVFAIRAVLCFMNKSRPVWRVFCIVFAAIFIACGVLAIIFENDCLKICYFVIGALLILAGASQITLAIKLSLEKAKEEPSVPAAPEKEDKTEAKKDKPEVIDYTAPEKVKEIENKPE